MTPSTQTAAERAAQLYRDEMARLNVPEHLREGLVRYLVSRIRPGSFLCAVIADDAAEVLHRAASDLTVADLAALASFLLQVAPVECWGSYEALERWLDRGLHPDAHLGAVIENSVNGGESMNLAIGQAVRYKPGTGTYGYEESIEADGRIPAVVQGFTRTRVRIDMTLTVAGRKTKKLRAVDAASLQKSEARS